MSRNPRDFYETPAWCTKALLESKQWKVPPSALVWEPCCGDGAIVRMMLGAGYRVVASDLYAQSAKMPPGVTFTRCDAAHTLTAPYGISAIVTNPPFRLAYPIARSLVGLSVPVWLLMPLAFLASARRGHWLRSNTPSGLIVLSRRPSFTHNGKTDMAEYAWIGWNTGPALPIEFAAPTAHVEQLELMRVDSSLTRIVD